MQNKNIVHCAFTSKMTNEPTVQSNLSNGHLIMNAQYTSHLHGSSSRLHLPLNDKLLFVLRQL